MAANGATWLASTSLPCNIIIVFFAWMIWWRKQTREGQWPPIEKEEDMVLWYTTRIPPHYRANFCDANPIVRAAATVRRRDDSSRTVLETRKRARRRGDEEVPKGSSNSNPYGGDLLTEPSGRPLPRFIAAPTAATDAYTRPVGAEAEIGIGFSGRSRLPSGPYFLGLPLFFFTVPSAPTPAGATTNPAGGATGAAIPPASPAGFSSPTTPTASAADGGWKLLLPSAVDAATASPGEGTPPSVRSMHRRAALRTAGSDAVRRFFVRRTPDR
ncbi:hypothetical protein BHM03_00040518 [Ensete ventricosum]|nr:hypothetical protein BHM03_00040518 [Ensete ventricosum]